MSITIDRRSARPAGTGAQAIVVDVVDGNGLEVPGQPVIAHMSRQDGVDAAIEAVTDGNGRARMDIIDGVSSVTLISGHESVGPIRPDHDSHLVIEM